MTAPKLPVVVSGMRPTGRLHLGHLHGALGALYDGTATRYYAAKASILITQVGNDRLDTSMTGDESQRRNTMPTFENMMRSAKVLERALAVLGPEDRIDLEGAPRERWVGIIQGKLTARAIRATSAPS